MSSEVLRLLVVDDSPDDLAFVVGLLEGARCRIATAGSFDDACGVVQSGGFDAVICDLRLPDGSGTDLADRLHHVAPVLVMTGHEEPDQSSSMIAMGAADFLVKEELTASGLRRAIVAAIGRFTLQRENEALRAIADEVAERERVARQEAERALADEQRARERMSLLFELAADLTVAQTLDAAIAAVVERVRRAVGAEALSLYTCNGVDLRLRGASGFSDAALDPWRVIPLSAPTPLSDAARTGATASFLMTQDIVHRYGLTVAPGRTWFAVPLRGGNVVTGVLGLKYLPEHVPDEPTLDLLAVVAVLVGQTLRRAQLLDEARENADREARMLAVLGHDLRSPLDVISLAPALLRRGQAVEPVLVRLERAAAAMRDLIADILARSAARHAATAEPETLVDFATEVKAQVEQLRAGNPQREIDLELANQAPVLVDRIRLAQIISNLVRNALVHGEPTSPVVVTAASNESGARIEVANAGPEIPADVRHKLFRPFERGRSSTGFGLGLFIVHETAAHLGGSVDVRSGRGRTVFTVSLPPTSPRRLA